MQKQNLSPTPMKRAKAILVLLVLGILAGLVFASWESDMKCVRTSQQLERHQSGTTWWRTVCVEFSATSDESD